ncbi:MAG TPA: response regulator [Aggregatilineales bacterium]|nr:response regulator [Aggregatilineales bacterium]
MESLLLIEDDPQTARMVRRVLASEPYTFHHASTGLDGLKVARQVLPEIVLVDLNLPDLAGKPVMLQLRGRIFCPAATIIAFTAEDDARTRRVVRGMGCDDLIGKPIDTRTFVQQIKDIIKRKAL